MQGTQVQHLVREIRSHMLHGVTKKNLNSFAQKMSPSNSQLFPFILLSFNTRGFYYIFREGNGTPLQYSCLENPMDGGAWWDAVHGVAKSRTRLSDFTFTFHFRALEKEMATHSNVLAWRIPGTGS